MNMKVIVSVAAGNSIEKIFQNNEIFLKGVHNYIVDFPFEILKRVDYIRTLFYIIDDSDLKVKDEWVKLLESEGIVCVPVSKDHAEGIIKSLLEKLDGFREVKKELEHILATVPEAMEYRRAEAAKRIKAVF